VSLLRAFLALFGSSRRTRYDVVQPEPARAEEPPLPLYQPQQPEPAAKKKSALVALVGASAAIALATMVAKDESGRTVEATVTQEGQLEVRHVRGPQYLRAYQDIVGVWTICDGDTNNVRAGMVETEAGCRDRLERQLVAHAAPILRCVPALGRPERENQLVASVSLAYNIGTGGFCRSTAARRFNAGDWRGGCDAFLMWNKAGGQVVRGLTLRRERERALCLRGL
jgi:lysozyme